jgi:hypothetical protein
MSNNYKLYEEPAVTMHEVYVEGGFVLSGGSGIEQVGGRLDEETWE